MRKLASKRLASATGAALILVAAAGSASAQSANPCRDNDLAQRRNALAKIVTDPANELVRSLSELPAVPDSEVVAVTDPKVCAAARDAYNSALAPGQRTPDRSVYVIRVGKFFSVEDPTVHWGQFGMAMTLDERFAVISQHTQ